MESVWGSPLVPAVAALFMTHVAQKLKEYHEYDKINTYYRYVDDTFIVMNARETDSENLLQYVNGLHPNIRFTCEREKNQEISFFRCQNLTRKDKICHNCVQKSNKHGVIITLAQLPTTKVQIGDDTNADFQSLIYLFIKKKVLNEECRMIEEMLTKNGYPLNLVGRRMKNTIE